MKYKVSWLLCVGFSIGAGTSYAVTAGDIAQYERQLELYTNTFGQLQERFIVLHGPKEVVVPPVSPAVVVPVDQPKSGHVPPIPVPPPSDPEQVASFTPPAMQQPTGAAEQTPESTIPLPPPPPPVVKPTQGHGSSTANEDDAASSVQSRQKPSSAVMDLLSEIERGKPLKPTEKPEKKPTRDDIYKFFEGKKADAMLNLTQQKQKETSSSAEEDDDDEWNDDLD